MKHTFKWGKQLEMSAFESAAWDDFAIAAMHKITLPIEDGLPSDVIQAANWANEMTVAKRNLTKVVWPK